MSAYLLRRSDEEKGFSALVNRTFDRVKAAYGRALEITFRARGAIYAAWQTHARRRSNPAHPYMCRFSRFSRW